MPQHTHAHRVLLPVLLCVVTLLVIACGGSSPQTSNAPVPAPPDKQVLRLPLGAPDFTTLDPGLAIDVQDNNAVSMIFSGLVKLNPDGTAVDDLAASHSVSSDGLTYTFKLKPGLKFSDGTPLTTTDVAYSINRALLPATKSSSTSNLAVLKDFDAITSGKITTLIGDSLVVKDDLTIDIVLGQPAAYFLQTLASSNALTVNRKLIDKYAGKWTDHLSEGAGAGVFEVSSYSHSAGLTLVPNPNYSGPKTRLQKVELLPTADPGTTYKEYLAGQLDFAGVPSGDIATAKSRKDFRHGPAPQIIFLGMNYLAKPFDNIKIRQAFALALNKDVLSQRVLHDAYIPTNHLIPEGIPGFNRALKGPAGVSGTAGDANKAKQLLQQGLQEAGYSSVSALPAITFTAPESGQDFKNLTEAIVQQWQTVLGVNVQLSTVSGAVFSQQDANTIGHAGPLQIWLSGWANIPDPYFWLSQYFGTKGYNDVNYGQSSDQKAIQQQLTQADANLNTKQRSAQYNDAEQKMVDDVAWLPLIQAVSYSLVNPKLQNYPTSGFATPWSDIYFSQ